MKHHGHPSVTRDQPSAEPAGEVIDDEPTPDLLGRELETMRAELEALATAEPPADIDERAEALRERYSELLDDHGDDPEALTRIRALGRRIKDLEEAGLLPRSMIRRGRSRR
jgi:DNA-binding transcriptional ArsR family regulator